MARKQAWQRKQKRQGSTNSGGDASEPAPLHTLNTFQLRELEHQRVLAKRRQAAQAEVALVKKRLKEIPGMLEEKIVAKDAKERMQIEVMVASLISRCRPDSPTPVLSISLPTCLPDLGCQSEGALCRD